MRLGVIFYLDGVIVDSHPAHKRAWRSLLASLGRVVSARELEFVQEGHRRDEILRHFLGELTPEQVREYGAHKEALFREALDEVKTVEGVVEFLDRLEDAGIGMAVASSASRHRVGYMLERFGLRQRFRAVVSGDDVVKSKPEPDIFQMAARGLGVSAVSALVCEDSPIGVMAARRARMKCLGIAADGRGNVLAQAGADKVVRDFVEVRVADVRALFRLRA